MSTRNRLSAQSILELVGRSGSIEEARRDAERVVAEVLAEVREVREREQQERKLRERKQEQQSD